jgi:hypothetical protein
MTGGLPAGLSERALEAVLEGAEPLVDVIPVEQQHVTQAIARQTSEPITVLRREQTLVRDFQDYLEARGSSVGRLRVVPTGEANAIRNDLYDTTRGLLVEAKGTGSRDAVRMALGQLLDYGRFAPNAKRAVLLPDRPRPDLEALLRLRDVHAVWRKGEVFADNADGGRVTDKSSDHTDRNKISVPVASTLALLVGLRPGAVRAPRAGMARLRFRDLVRERHGSLDAVA